MLDLGMVARCWIWGRSQSVIYEQAAFRVPPTTTAPHARAGMHTGRSGRRRRRRPRRRTPRAVVARSFVVLCVGPRCVSSLGTGPMCPFGPSRPYPSRVRVGRRERSFSVPTRHGMVAPRRRYSDRPMARNRGSHHRHWHCHCHCARRARRAHRPVDCHGTVHPGRVSPDRAVLYRYPGAAPGARTRIGTHVGRIAPSPRRRCVALVPAMPSVGDLGPRSLARFPPPVSAIVHRGIFGAPHLARRLAGVYRPRTTCRRRRERGGIVAYFAPHGTAVPVRPVPFFVCATVGTVVVAVPFGRPIAVSVPVVDPTGGPAVGRRRRVRDPVSSFARSDAGNDVDGTRRGGGGGGGVKQRRRFVLMHTVFCFSLSLSLTHITLNRPRAACPHGPCS